MEVTSTNTQEEITEQVWCLRYGFVCCSWNNTCGNCKSDFFGTIVPSAAIWSASWEA